MTTIGSITNSEKGPDYNKKGRKNKLIFEHRSKKPCHLLEPYALAHDILGR